MANPQIENGHTRVANEILEQIMKVSLNGTQFRLVMSIWRYTYGFQRKHHEMSIRFLAESIDAGRSQVDRELAALIERKIIIVAGAGRRGGRSLGFNKNHKEWTDCPPRSGQYGVSSTEGTKKESIKENSKENIYVPVISHLNEKAGKRFSAKSPANKKLINGRMAEGRTLEDFLHVIDVKCEEWLDNPQMEKYLRPTTLFAQTKFENYVNQKPKEQQGKASDSRDKEIEFQQFVQNGGNPSDFDWST